MNSPQDPSTSASTPSLRTSDAFDQRIELARKLADQRQFSDATVLFDWLCETYPNRAAAFVDSANNFARDLNYDGVEKRLAEIESKPPVPADVWSAMAKLTQRLNRPAWVLRFLENASAGNRPTAAACGQLARYLERLRRIDDAEEWSARGLKIDPGDAECQLVRAILARRRGDVDAASRAVDLILKNSDAPLRTRISAHHESAHVRDSTGDYAGAIASLQSAKKLFIQQGEFEHFQKRAAAGQRTHHRFLTTITPDYFRATAGATPRSPQRLAMLGGHPRSGTTLLEQILDSHSDVISAEETPVFAEKVNEPFLRSLTGENLSQDSLQAAAALVEELRQDYFKAIQRVLDQSLGDRLLIDKNPSCTDCIPVFDRIFPESVYIIALRDPRDVVLSCFFQDLPLNDVTVHFQTLEETAMRYANTMAMWLVCRENMDEKKWIEVRYESLVTDLSGEAKKVMSKLNLDWQEQQQKPEYHARSKSVMSPTYADVAQPVHTRAIGKWKRYEPWLGEALPILETFVEAFEY